MFQNLSTRSGIWKGFVRELVTQMLEHSNVKSILRWNVVQQSERSLWNYKTCYQKILSATTPKLTSSVEYDFLCPSKKIIFISIDKSSAHFHFLNIGPISIFLKVGRTTSLYVKTNPTKQQNRKIVPALARLQVRWLNIVPYMGTHWANFPGLSGMVCFSLYIKKIH